MSGLGEVIEKYSRLDFSWVSPMQRPVRAIFTNRANQHVITGIESSNNHRAHTRHEEVRTCHDKRNTNLPARDLR